MPRLDRPVTIGPFTLRGVDDWLCFCTDAAGAWFYFQTECSPLWPMLPRCFVGEVGYPDTAEGVLATAILEARAGVRPTPLNPEFAAEIETAFGERSPLSVAEIAALIPALIAAAEADGLTIDDGNVVDLVADNIPSAAITDIRRALIGCGLRDRFKRAAAGRLCKNEQSLCRSDGGCLSCPADAGELCHNA